MKIVRSRMNKKEFILYLEKDEEVQVLKEYNKVEETDEQIYLKCISAFRGISEEQFKYLNEKIREDIPFIRTYIKGMINKNRYITEHEIEKGIYNHYMFYLDHIERLERTKLDEWFNKCKSQNK